MNEVVGHYVDYEMTSPLQMARHSAQIKPMGVDLARRGLLLLTTCLRVEVYGEKFDVESTDIEVFRGFPHKVVEGSNAVAQRLAEISSGAKSQILGEPYIQEQLSKAVGLLDPDLRICRISRLAIDVSCGSRERQRFTAPFNYDRIVCDMIAEQLGGSVVPDRLYVIGAGMLGRELVSTGPGKMFRSTVVVTRNPKNLRKRLGSRLKIGVDMMRLGEIGCIPEPHSAVVIATADVNPEYQAVLQDALLRLAPLIVIDLSSIPVLQAAAVARLNYVTMYDQQFLQRIAENNKYLMSKLPQLQSDIQTRLLAGGIP
ncbi:hypothetical protein HFO89_31140 [Rhizobium leguminosarum]|uniref:hypothetical protein n=1 Tax=Rhizobium leguminosarum TaxID=384 RepID=UPI001C95140B|nr:hypothetical protein [Rhizobium leguminosarum]MBY5460732.1 hypothetical protein [Rhizobium leguminosarum]